MGRRSCGLILPLDTACLVASFLQRQFERAALLIYLALALFLGGERCLYAQWLKCFKEFGGNLSIDARTCEGHAVADHLPVWLPPQT